jgi:putative ABC transport system permease protein
VNTLLQDLRYGARQLRKTPGSTAVAIITVALGIGATTAIFSVVAAVLLRPLPYPDASRVMLLHESSEAIPEMSISMANFNDWRARSTVFENLSAFQGNDVVMSGRGEPERLQMRRVTASLFPTLGVPPLLGRAMLPEEDKVGAEKVVLLGDGFWQRRFGFLWMPRWRISRHCPAWKLWASRILCWAVGKAGTKWKESRNRTMGNIRQRIFLG